jgi:hypothetical protein
MNRSLLITLACVLLLAGVCAISAQEEKKTPPPPTNQPPVSRAGIKCVGITSTVTGPEGRPTITLFRAWDDGVVEVSTLTQFTGVATKWRRYEELIK